MSNRVWPLPLAAREGFETARAGRWSSLLVVVAIAWACAAPGAVDAIGVSRQVEGERAWLDAGGRTLVITGAHRAGDDVDPIPAAKCDALSRVDGIDASFAVSRSVAVGTLAHIPGGRVGLYEVTPGALKFLGAKASPGGTVLATLGFADRAGVAEGDEVRVVRQAGQNAHPATSDLLTVDVIDSEILTGEFEGSLLVPYVPSADSEAVACYVQTDTAHYAAVQAATASWLATGTMPAIVTPRLDGGAFVTDYRRAYEDRPLRWTWVPTAALLALVWAMIQWFRRGHVAIYATFGARSHSRLIMQAAEWGVLASVGAIWGWSLGVVCSIAFGARAAQAFASVSFHTGLTILGATGLVVLLGLRPTGTLLNALKDR